MEEEEERRPPPSRYRLSATVSMVTTDIISTKNTYAGDTSETGAGIVSSAQCPCASVLCLSAAVASTVWLHVVLVGLSVHLLTTSKARHPKAASLHNLESRGWPFTTIGITLKLPVRLYIQVKECCSKVCQALVWCTRVAL